MQKLFVLVCCLLGSSWAMAQDYASTASNGNVKVIKDSRVDVLIKKQIYINTLAIRNQSGFRVQVISTNKRGDANEAKAKVMQLYSDYRTYMDYQAPYFKVRVGDFKSREEASELRDKLSGLFSGGVFVVPAIINVSPDKELSNEEPY
ncbi:SPOR domain-containing protein [Chitinophaga nivalis]|uniref:SPOR domain-containing protein n=1 Tax=Chitinophaga nivalis TaxID=2991709 RepID=A0ABT3ITY3_9BACT|nr:SPOR domain-containing protein [Chitinophaga nivalis]MCW3462954.1 SPOR domain-containing protein [Chitinophaga nivalis]MCW3487356.1 SPOR domain-containing protein [Chitinophaga nivalis]